MKKNAALRGVYFCRKAREYLLTACLTFPRAGAVNALRADKYKTVVINCYA